MPLMIGVGGTGLQIHKTCFTHTFFADKKKKKNTIKIVPWQFFPDNLWKRKSCWLQRLTMNSHHWKVGIIFDVIAI